MTLTASKQKATFALDATLLAAAQAVVQDGGMPSMDALLEQALTDFLAKLRSAAIR